jgi:Na+/H+ antiporter NhaA
MVSDQFIFGVGIAVTLLTGIGIILSLFVSFLKRSELDDEN